MRRIDKLLQQAKANRPGETLSFVHGICIPYSDKGVYKATACLWNHKEGAARVFEALSQEYKTKEEVKEWFNEMEKQYPPRPGEEPRKLFIGFSSKVSSEKTQS